MIFDIRYYQNKALGVSLSKKALSGSSMVIIGQKYKFPIKGEEAKKSGGTTGRIQLFQELSS